jgi:hypothetical protein
MGLVGTFKKAGTFEKLFLLVVDLREPLVKTYFH